MVAQSIAKILQSRSPKSIAGNHFRPAAVLVPIQEREDGDYLVLTQRAEKLNHHSGQVAFPGGRVDAGDHGEMAAALREAQEEIGMDPRCVRILGRLDQVTAAYSFVVTPFVGLIPSPYEFRLNPSETAAVFSVPLPELLKPSCVSVDDRLSSRGEPIYHFQYDGWDIWGATARIIVQLLELVYGYEIQKHCD
jgi:8-oxo-dGTP pyrophosphatase MutT (NUDIX family)